MVAGSAAKRTARFGVNRRSAIFAIKQIAYSPPPRLIRLVFSPALVSIHPRHLCYVSSFSAAALRAMIGKTGFVLFQFELFRADRTNFDWITHKSLRRRNQHGRAQPLLPMHPRSPIPGTHDAQLRRHHLTWGLPFAIPQSPISPGYVVDRRRTHGARQCGMPATATARSRESAPAIPAPPECR